MCVLKINPVFDLAGVVSITSFSHYTRYHIGTFHVGFHSWSSRIWNLHSTQLSVPTLSLSSDSCFSFRPVRACIRNRVRDYGKLLLVFIARSGVRQSFILSSFLSNFVTGIIMEITLSSCENDDIDIYSNSRLLDLEYGDRRKTGVSRY